MRDGQCSASGVNAKWNTEADLAALNRQWDSLWGKRTSTLAGLTLCTDPAPAPATVRRRSRVSSSAPQRWTATRCATVHGTCRGGPGLGLHRSAAGHGTHPHKRLGTTQR